MTLRLFPDRTFDAQAIFGPLLDYAVVLAEQRNGIATSRPLKLLASEIDHEQNYFEPSSKPEDCYPISSRCDRISLSAMSDGWKCVLPTSDKEDEYVTATGPTMLIAFCRAYCVQMLGHRLEL